MPPPQQQQQQQQPQPHHQHLASPQTQGARPSAPAPPSHHRNLASANWRAHTAEDVIFSQPPRIMYNPFDVTPTHHLQHPSARPTSFPNARMDQYQNLQTNASVISYPNLGPTSDVQLDSSFAYCYDRGNGQYTRLIPADMLPPLQNIPALQQSCIGMVVVPQPRGLPPNGYSSNTEPVALRVRKGFLRQLHSCLNRFASHLLLLKHFLNRVPLRRLLRRRIQSR